MDLAPRSVDPPLPVKVHVFFEEGIPQAEVLISVEKGQNWEKFLQLLKSTLVEKGIISANDVVKSLEFVDKDTGSVEGVITSTRVLLMNTDKKIIVRVQIKRFVQVSFATETEHMKELARRIRSGNVVCFLGAGFLMNLGPRFGSWHALLVELLEFSVSCLMCEKPLPLDPSPNPKCSCQHPLRCGIERGDAKYNEIKRQLDMRGGVGFMRAAQLIEDEISSETLFRKTGEFLKMPMHRDLQGEMKRRLAMIRLIPFRCILTTNYTKFLSHELDDESTSRIYSLDDDHLDLANLLRPEEELAGHLEGDDEASPTPLGIGGGGGQTRRRERDALQQAPNAGDREIQLLNCMRTGGQSELPIRDMNDSCVFHIHGTKNPVISKQAYRQMLHRMAHSQPFLRTLMATSSFFYFGFSFSDEYLENIRSEVLAMLTSSSTSRIPILGYAVIADQTQADLQFRARHEGIAVLTYNTGGTHNHSRCDEVLTELVEETSMPYRLASSLRGKKILAVAHRNFHDLVALRLCKLVWAAEGAGVSPRQQGSATSATSASAWGGGARGEAGGGGAGAPVQYVDAVDDYGFCKQSAEDLAAEKEKDFHTFKQKPLQDRCVYFPLPNEGTICVVFVTDEEDIPTMIRGGPHTADAWDMVITNYGFRDAQQPPFAVSVSDTIRQLPHTKWAPVLCFGQKPSNEEHAKNRWGLVARGGCIGYEHSFDGVAEVMLRIFPPPVWIPPPRLPVPEIGGGTILGGVAVLGGQSAPAEPPQPPAAPLQSP